MNTRKFPLVWAVIFFHANVFGQVAPGGVKGLMKWYITDTIAKTPSYYSKIGGRDSSISLKGFSPYELMNFNKALVFDGNQVLPLNLSDSSMAAATYFTVFKNQAPKLENVVWHITKNNKTTIVTTTSRLADLEDYKYRNYIDLYPELPKINVYSQQKTDSIFPAKQYWYVGGKPVSPNIASIVSFKGLIPELIAYNRVLSADERLRIITYLAIKYGITIVDPEATYLSSGGMILWDGLSDREFHNNIAGIGRDDLSGLLQLKSTSSNTPGLLTISSPKFASNNNFILWGENQKHLIPAEKISGVPIPLQKKWLVASSVSKSPALVDVFFDTKQIDSPLPIKPIYWLVIDRTGKGNFSLSGAEYIKMDSLSEAGIAQYKSVPLGTSSKEVIGFVVGKPLMLTTEATEPDCNAPNGRLHVKIIGGRSPFILTVTTNSGGIIYKKTITNDTEDIGNLPANKYSVSVTDANNENYSDVVFINNKNAPQLVGLSGKYVFKHGANLTLRADSGMSPGLNYEWTGPRGFKSNDPTITITQGGLYSIKCSNDGCTYQQDIIVTEQPESNFSKILIYPNPSFGDFSVDVTLVSPAELKMSVFSVDGKIIADNNWKGSGQANYRINGHIRTAGQYTLNFMSGTSIVGKILVVVNNN